jgi:hypothetical protein
MKNPMLFDMPEMVEKINWGDFATSFSFDERKIITWIMQLHNEGRPFDLDSTYSTGRFWKGLPKPKYKFDLHPQLGDVISADASRLPLPAGSMRSIMFDPPFLPDDKNAKSSGIIRQRFGTLPTTKKLYEFYNDALSEFWRLLSPKGIVAFKCQDFVHSSKQHISLFEVMKSAEKIGFYMKDLFIYGRMNILWSPNMKNQKHARKTHSYFLVLVKK